MVNFWFITFHTRRYESGVLKIYNSMELPPNLSGDERSDTWSVGSSACGSLRSLSGAERRSALSSSHVKVSSHSSGFWSVETISESVGKNRNQRNIGCVQDLKT